MKTKLNKAEIAAICVIVIGISLVLYVTFGKTKNALSSKAEGTTIDCTSICATYLPNSANFTENPDGCVKACNRVNAQIAKGKSCSEACNVLRPARAKVCRSVCEKAGIK